MWKKDLKKAKLSLESRVRESDLFRKFHLSRALKKIFSAYEGVNVSPELFEPILASTDRPKADIDAIVESLTSNFVSTTIKRFVKKTKTNALERRIGSKSLEFFLDEDNIRRLVKPFRDPAMVRVVGNYDYTGREYAADILVHVADTWVDDPEMLDKAMSLLLPYVSAINKVGPKICDFFSYADRDTVIYTVDMLRTSHFNNIGVRVADLVPQLAMIVKDVGDSHVRKVLDILGNSYMPQVIFFMGLLREAISKDSSESSLPESTGAIGVSDSLTKHLIDVFFDHHEYLFQESIRPWTPWHKVEGSIERFIELFELEEVKACCSYFESTPRLFFELAQDYSFDNRSRGMLDDIRKIAVSLMSFPSEQLSPYVFSSALKADSLSDLKARIDYLHQFRDAPFFESLISSVSFFVKKNLDWKTMVKKIDFSDKSLDPSKMNIYLADIYPRIKDLFADYMCKEAGEDVLPGDEDASSLILDYGAIEMIVDTYSLLTDIFGDHSFNPYKLKDAGLQEKAKSLFFDVLSKKLSYGESYEQKVRILYEWCSSAYDLLKDNTDDFIHLVDGGESYET